MCNKLHSHLLSIHKDQYTCIADANAFTFLTSRITTHAVSHVHKCNPMRSQFGVNILACSDSAILFICQYLIFDTRQWRTVARIV